jgi:hypothetical protein
MTDISRRRLLQGGAVLAGAFGAGGGARADTDDQRFQFTLDLLSDLAV